MENYARKWCLCLCAILFEVTLGRFERCGNQYCERFLFRVIALLKPSQKPQKVAIQFEQVRFLLSLTVDTRTFFIRSPALIAI